MSKAEPRIRIVAVLIERKSKPSHSIVQLVLPQCYCSKVVVDRRIGGRQRRGSARLFLPNGIEIPAGEDGTVMLPLPRDTSGVLRRGDLPLRLETARGPIEFLVGIDADGTPAAISGSVRSPGGEALSGR